LKRDFEETMSWQKKVDGSLFDRNNGGYGYLIEEIYVFLNESVDEFVMVDNVAISSVRPEEVESRIVTTVGTTIATTEVSKTAATEATTTATTKTLPTTRFIMPKMVKTTKSPIELTTTIYRPLFTDHPSRVANDQKPSEILVDKQFLYIASGILFFGGFLFSFLVLKILVKRKFVQQSGNSNRRISQNDHRRTSSVRMGNQNDLIVGRRDQDHDLPNYNDLNPVPSAPLEIELMDSPPNYKDL